MTSALDRDLRERFSDPEGGLRELEASRRQLSTRRANDSGSEVDRSHVGRALQRLSEHCRLSGLLEESLSLKDETILVWRTLGKHRASFLVRLQRALVLAELGHADAAQTLEELGRELDSDDSIAPFYRDFWLEYDARRLFWEGSFEQAHLGLLAALAIRRECRNARIVEWTEHALSVVSRSL